MTPTIAGSLFALWIAAAGLATWFLRRAAIRAGTRRRLVPRTEADAAREVESEASRGRMGWWLYRAGYRSPRAVPLFVALTLVGLGIGAGFVVATYATGLVDLASGLLESVPGHVGEILLPFVWASPWLSGLLMALRPAIAVRRRRLRRVLEVEQDLPLTLDLLSMLAEAGFGFDAALERLLETQPTERPLSEDLALFQIDVLAGRQRVDVGWFSIFVSAVIHAEQVGAGLAQTLRLQADDLRMRRRERALALAMAVPVKLLPPLIVCFLPGIMVAALGPITLQIVQVLDSLLQGTQR